MADRTYFLVEPGSPVLDVIADAKAKQAEHFAAAKAFAAEFGAKRWYETTGWDVRVLGLVFDSEPPEGWRIFNKNKAYCVPRKSAPAGKLIAARMDALPKGVSGNRFSGMLDAAFSASGESKYSRWVDVALHWSAFEHVGEHFVLSIPVACKVSPPGCRELKMSEYWQLKEEAEKAVPA